MAIQIQYLPVDDLKPYEKNSRTHSDEQIDQIAKSIKEFGFTNPVLLDGARGIIAGHGRLLAAKKLGLKEVPTIELGYLTPAQKRAYVIADNKLALNAGWDTATLLAEIDALRLDDFKLDLLGFTDEELAALDPEVEDEEEEEDEGAGDIPADPKVVLGDLFLLGDHRLLCGDATVVTDVERLIAGAKPSLMVTDPPYGVSYEAGWRATAKGVTATEREETSSLQNDDRADWYDAWVLFPGAVAYVWHASAFTDVVMDSLRRAGFEIRTQIIWNKNVHALSRGNYHFKHEPCWYAVKKGAEARWLGGRDKMTVWDIKAIMHSGEEKTAHPTQKPLAIYEIPYGNHTLKGDHIYEPFGGSGSALMACEKLGRKSLTMELDPKFVAVILNRWEEKTGKKAKREDGELWADIKCS